MFDTAELNITETVDQSITAHQLLAQVAQHSLACSIGSDFLGLAHGDDCKQIFHKMERALRSNPEHVLEIALTALTAIAVEANDKTEMLSSCITTLGLSDRALSH